MRISLTESFKSIQSLNAEELPDFAVLIGRNGAGKSQLLAGLTEGVATADNISREDIELYDMVSFRPPNTNVGGRNSNHFARKTADDYLLPRGDDKAPIEIAADIFDEFVGNLENTLERDEFVREWRDEISNLQDFAVFGPTDGRASEYARPLYEQVMAPFIPSRNQRRSRQSSQAANSFNGNPASLISSAMKLAGKLPHELTRDDIMQAAHYEGPTISNSISEVFATYKVEQYIWAHKRIETEHVSFPDLVAEFRRKYPPPWDTLRDVLSAMRGATGDEGVFDFEFSDPDGVALDMGNYERFSFKAEMTNRTTGARYDLDSLSSGEKVLMALCLLSFNQYLGRRRPKLLLLDELDAVLHPSMVLALIATLKSLFVQHGTKVLMTSHLPMTVAALDENEIYRVVRASDAVDISSTSKTEAIRELSEGLATVDVGLRIAASSGAEVTILSEGQNARHLKKWVQLNFPGRVHVFDELERHTSKSELLAYGRLLARMNTNTHFVIVWDCDAVGQAEDLRGELSGVAHITPFAFQKRSENEIAGRGIENNYEEQILEPYAIIKRDSDGNLLGRDFNKSRKREFADHVAREGTPDYFIHFNDLHDVVSAILEASTTTSGGV